MVKNKENGLIYYYSMNMKKLYMNTLMQLFVALCTFSFVACQEFEIDSQPEGPLNIQIDALESYEALATSPSNVVFNISSNTPWIIESDAQWCVPTPSMSAASSLVAEIVVSMEDNTDKEARTAHLTITAEGIDTPTTVTIVQASKEDLQVIDYTEAVPTEGGEITFEIVSNKAWEVIPSVDFLSDITPASGTGDDTGLGERIPITINIPANNGAVREGVITVRTEFQEHSFTIIQGGISIGLPEDQGTPSIDDYMGGTISVPIVSNTEWRVQVPAEYESWLTAERDGSNLVLTAAPNNLLTTRVGQVLLFPQEEVIGFEGIAVEVNQTSHVNLAGSADFDSETNAATIQSTAQNRFSTKFSFKKGKLTWTFDEINIPEGSTACFDINGDTWHWNGANGGAGWIHFYLRPQDQASTLQLHYEWNSVDMNIDVNSIRTLEYETKDDPDSPGRLITTMSINGEAIQTFSTVDVFTTADNELGYINQGQVIYFGFAGAGDPVGTMTIRSLDYEPYE